MFFQQDYQVLLVQQLRKLLEKAAAPQLSQLGTPQLLERLFYLSLNHIFENIFKIAKNCYNV